jgi:hypothetical protein
MSWIDRLAKGAQEGVSRATTEADRAIKLTRVTTDINSKKGELDRAFSVIGAVVWEMHHKGVTLPDGMAEQFATVDALQQHLQELETQREALKAGPASAAPTAPAGTQPNTGGPATMEGTVIDPQASRQIFCGGCGASLAPDAKFCFSCGRPTGS